MDQKPFEDFGDQSAFAENPEPRCACVLVLDVSGSMAGSRISELNDGLRSYQEDVTSDALASKRVEVAVVTFGGGVETKQPFIGASSFSAPVLDASGHTPMGEAINRAIDLVEERKRVYRDNGIMYFRPWIFLITDGEPNDEWQSVIPRIRDGEEHKSFSFYAVGCGEANLEVLKQIATRQPLTLKGMRFRDLLKWLSNSQRSISRSTPGEEVPLQNPTAPDGWAVA